MDPERRESLAQVIRDFRMDERWIDALDDDGPGWLSDLMHGWVAASSAGDVEWILDRIHPDLVIVQPAEFPDRRTYLGREGMIEAFLDWPAEWEDFMVEPTRIFAVGDEQNFIVDAMHSGRSRKMGFEVEVQIVWLFAMEDGSMRSWKMFTSLDEALEAAGS